LAARLHEQVRAAVGLYVGVLSIDHNVRLILRAEVNTYVRL